MATATITDVSSQFADAIARKFTEADARKHQASPAVHPFAPVYTATVMRGRKYDRIVLSHVLVPGSPSRDGSAHAFVERETGLLFKAEGWSTPAKGARYDLSTPEGLAGAIEAADPFTAYLYRRL